MQCEVIWMDGTGVKTERKSAGASLDVYGILMKMYIPFENMYEQYICCNRP